MQRSGHITHCNGLLTVEEVSGAFKWDIKQLFFAKCSQSKSAKWMHDFY